jgi:cation diffusion facilitator family transporter
MRVLSIESKEKRNVALSSVIAAIFLTSFKLVVGLLTGSLGILSEALHSMLDLIAAVITFFAVTIADKPADEDHQFGHGKFENLSAFFETILLVITCVWIIQEAVTRLSTGKTEIIVNAWSFIVVITAIVIDFTRSRMLMRTAKKYHSQALEADGLHFSTDILSSTVVLIGLIFSSFGLYFVDSVASLGVAVIVLYISWNIGKRAIDALLDRTTSSITNKITTLGSEIPQIFEIHSIKSRQSGATTMIEVTIEVDPNLSVSEGHEIATQYEDLLTDNFHKAQINIHIEPYNENESKEIS